MHSDCAELAEHGGKSTREGVRNGVRRHERMKRGSDMKDRGERSRGIEMRKRAFVVYYESIKRELFVCFFKMGFYYSRIKKGEGQGKYVTFFLFFNHNFFTKKQRISIVGSKSREERKVKLEDERETQFKYIYFALYVIATCVL